MGLQVTLPKTGCCGQAGSFGYEKEHYDVSMKIGEQDLLPAVRKAAGDTLIVADGFSCREQIGHATDRWAMHPAKVVALALQHKADVAAEEAADVYREPAARVDRKSLAVAALTAAVGGVLIAVAARR